MIANEEDIALKFTHKEKYNIDDLLAIVKLLREPQGCPWDREQTHQSIRKNLIEETYEVADAIDQQNSDLLCEELGDLLLQIVMHVQMEKEAQSFAFEDVCDGICKKLVYRHPHVFGEVDNAISTKQVLRNWEQLKNEEKGRTTAFDRLESVPLSLPALMRSEKLQKRAAEFGFSYANTDEAMQDLSGEMEELNQAFSEACNKQNIVEEIGDVLFSAVNVARLAGIDAEEALTASCNKFVSRVEYAEQVASDENRYLNDLNAEQLDALWTAAKQHEKQKQK